MLRIALPRSHSLFRPMSHRFFATCSRCGTDPLPGPEFFYCRTCQKMPPADSVDTVSYFEALAIDPKFDIDLKGAERHLYSLGPRFEALSRSGEDLNVIKAYIERCKKAFHIMSKPLLRAEYLIQTHTGLPPKLDGETLPAIQVLLDIADKDPQDIITCRTTNNEKIVEVEECLASCLKAENWTEAHALLQEAMQRARLNQTLSDLATENADVLRTSNDQNRMSRVQERIQNEEYKKR